MPEEIDDTTAALVGHAMIRWLVDEDPGNVARFVRELNPSEVDDEKAARLGRTVVELLERFAVA